ncbi:hypothetical protein B046DRAFT_00074 [Streptomyces sp. LamerLS-316]|nr:hypothetical protein B046DRAFT_00074 [Streptomyces sp. LamerLS-316]
MAGYLVAEYEALTRLIRDLSECAGGMRSTMAELKNIGPKGSGSDALEEACDDFQGKWEYGIKLIADATTGLTEKVAESGRLFQHQEDEIAALLRSVQVDPTGQAEQ